MNPSVGEVLVVDDDKGFREAMERLLQAGGFRLRCFASAEELLESSARPEAACLVLDVRLPGLSGFELRERLAEGGSRPPVIYMTAHDDPRAREMAKRDGAVEFLVKPFEGRKLLEALDGVLGGSR